MKTQDIAKRIYDAAEKCTMNHGHNSLICVVCAVSTAEKIVREAVAGERSACARVADDGEGER